MAVALFYKDLWSDVWKGSTTVELLLERIKYFWKSEVSYLDLDTFWCILTPVEKNIGWFEISVSYAKTFEVLYAFKNLVNNSCNLRLTHVMVWNGFGKIAITHLFHDNMNMVLWLEDILDLNAVWMWYYTNNIYLFF